MAVKKYIPYIDILLAGTCWGLIGLFNRRLLAGGFSPRDVVLVRNLGGLLLLGLFLLVFDRGALKVDWRHLPWFFGTGVVSVLLFTLLYFSCQEQCSLAVSGILLYTAPTFVVITSAILWKEPITRRKLAALAAAFLGCSFVSGIWSGGASVTLQGFLLGLGSGFFYAMYSIFGRYALARCQPMTVTFYTFVFAGLGSLFLTNPVRVASVLAGDVRLVWMALGLVSVATVLPYIFYTKGLARVESGKASIIASVEPVVAALAGVLAFGEPMSLSVLLGLGCILASIYILR